MPTAAAAIPLERWYMSGCWDGLGSDLVLDVDRRTLQTCIGSTMEEILIFREMKNAKRKRLSKRAKARIEMGRALVFEFFIGCLYQNAENWRPSN